MFHQSGLIISDTATKISMQNLLLKPILHDDCFVCCVLGGSHEAWIPLTLLAAEGK